MSKLNDRYNLLVLHDKYSDTERIKNITLIPRNISAALQRIKYGVSQYDVWSLDSFLYTILENGLRILKEDQNGYPFGYEQEEWDKELSNIIELIEYLNSDADTMPAVDLAYIKYRKTPVKSEAREMAREAWIQELNKEEQRRKKTRKVVALWLANHINDLWW